MESRTRRFDRGLLASLSWFEQSGQVHPLLRRKGVAAAALPFLPSSPHARFCGQQLPSTISQRAATSHLRHGWNGVMDGSAVIVGCGESASLQLLPTSHHTFSPGVIVPKTRPHARCLASTPMHDHHPAAAHEENGVSTLDSHQAHRSTWVWHSQLTSHQARFTGMRGGRLPSSDHRPC